MDKSSSGSTPKDQEIRIYEQYLMEEYIGEILKIYRDSKDNPKVPEDKRKALKVRINEHYATVILYFLALSLNIIQCILLCFLFAKSQQGEWLTTYGPQAAAKLIGIAFCILSGKAYYRQLYYDVEVFGQALSDISSKVSISELLYTLSDEYKRKKVAKKGIDSVSYNIDWTIVVDWLKNRPSVVIMLIWLLTCIWSPDILLKSFGYAGNHSSMAEWILMIIIELISFIAIFPKYSSVNYWKIKRSDSNHVVLWEALLVFGSVFFILPGVLSMLVSPLVCFVIILILALSIYLFLAVFSWNRIISNNEQDKRTLTQMHKLVQSIDFAPKSGNEELPADRFEDIRYKFNDMSSWGQIRFLEWLQTGDEIQNSSFNKVIDIIDDRSWTPKSDRVMVQMMKMVNGTK